MTSRAWDGLQGREGICRWGEAVCAVMAVCLGLATAALFGPASALEERSNDPEVGLRAVAALRVLTERLEMLQVDNARALGWSLHEIAMRLGVTKQTGHRKHGRRVGWR